MKNWRWANRKNNNKNKKTVFWEGRLPTRWLFEAIFSSRIRTVHKEFSFWSKWHFRGRNIFVKFSENFLKILISLRLLFNACGTLNILTDCECSKASSPSRQKLGKRIPSGDPGVSVEDEKIKNELSWQQKRTARYTVAVPVMLPKGHEVRMSCNKLLKTNYRFSAKSGNYGALQSYDLIARVGFQVPQVPAKN